MNVKTHKNGKVTVVMAKLDYRLIRLCLQRAAETTDSNLRNAIKDLVLPQMPAMV